MSSTLSTTLHDARTRWLDGDADAWARYAECCRQLEASPRAPLQAKCPSQTSIPLAWHRSSSTGTRAAQQ